MPTLAPAPPALLDRIRPQVRAEHAYRVPTDTHVAAKLDQNESPYGLPDEVLKEAERLAPAPEPNRYPDDRPHRLVAALADRLGLDPQGVIVGRGSNEITHTLGLAFVEEGTPVVLPHPMFALYASVVRMHGGSPVEVDPRPDFGHDPDAIIEAARRADAPLTVVTTPNNPTGQAFSVEALKHLAEGVPGFLLIDEAYWEFAPAPHAHTLVQDHANVLVMRTFSKAQSLAGVRLGYLLGDPAVIQELEKARLPFLVDRASEALGLAVLARPDLVRQRVAALVQARDALFRDVTALDGVEAVPSQANFFLFKTPLAPADLRARLAERGVLIRDVSGYRALKGWTRVSVGTEPQNRAFITALRAVLAQGE